MRGSVFATVIAQFALAMMLVLLAGPVPAFAQLVDGAPKIIAPVRTATTAQDRARERASRVQDLEAVRAALAVAEERRARLEAEVANAGRDRDAIARALLKSAQRSQELEGDIAEIQTRLDALERDRSRIRGSLAERRAALIEVIAALQRMGANPPPALLVKPEDALGAVRSALLLGAVVPQVRAEARALQLELEALARTGQAIAAQKAQQAQALEQLAEDEERLSMLAQQKANANETSQSAIQQAVAEAAALSGEAEDLEQAIARLDESIADASRAAAAARKADADRQAREAQRLALARQRLKSGQPLGNARGTLSAPALGAQGQQVASGFAKRRGALPRPVEGQRLFGFGDPLAIGTTRRVRSPNAAFATASGAIVRAPADGQIVYAGPFRSFGHVLILDAGDSYHIVLSGMGRVDVGEKAYVVAGQPVGAMGARAARRASVIAASDTLLGLNAPVLYVEFRKDGRPVDPAPWWANRQASAEETQ